jgi:hypothetical protein
MKNAAVCVVVVTPIGVDAAGAAHSCPRMPPIGTMALNKRNKLRDVVAIGASQDCRG